MTDQNRTAPAPEQLLGELEVAVMQLMWERSEATVRAMRDALHPTRPLAYTTVMTIMSRLAQKGLLTTRKQVKTYYYRVVPATPDAFVAQRAQQAVMALLASYGDLAIVPFLQAIEGIDPERLAALRALAAEE